MVDIPGLISRIAIDSKGRIVIGGSFRFVDRTPLFGLARFMPDGRVDQTFRWDHWQGPTAIDDFLLLSDDTILVVGSGLNEDWHPFLAPDRTGRVYYADPSSTDPTRAVQRYVLPPISPTITADAQEDGLLLSIRYGNLSTLTVQGSTTLNIWTDVAGSTNYSGSYSISLPNGPLPFNFFRAVLK